MASTSPLPAERDPKDDAEARAWAHEVQERAEAGELTSDADWLREKAEQEKRRLKRQ
jgi:hypothetical protein